MTRILCFEASRVLFADVFGVIIDGSGATSMTLLIAQSNSENKTKHTLLIPALVSVANLDHQSDSFTSEKELFKRNNS
jgi:threonine dehydratase